MANNVFLPNADKINFHMRVKAFVDADGNLALRERWVSHWNPYHDPKQLACATAVDLAMYHCAAIPQLVKSVYETGSLGPYVSLLHRSSSSPQHSLMTLEHDHPNPNHVCLWWCCDDVK